MDSGNGGLHLVRDSATKHGPGMGFLWFLRYTVLDPYSWRDGEVAW